jgi:uncharacterized phage-like protein YoqJ
MQDLYDFSVARERCCCFTGHRPNALPGRGRENQPGMKLLADLLESAVRRALDEGFTCFFAGGARGFDTIAAETVLRLGVNDPYVVLCLALPGRDQSAGWPAADCARYRDILGAAENRVWYAADACSPASMRSRNRFMADHSNRCIAYLSRMQGGTLYTVNYALESGVPVENLADTMAMLD